MANMAVPYPELTPKRKPSRHKTTRHGNRNSRANFKRNQIIINGVLITVCSGVVIGVSGVGVWLRDTKQSQSSQVSMCAMLSDIPAPPFPTPEQIQAIAYTNNYLFQIRQEFHCGR